MCDEWAENASDVAIYTNVGAHRGLAKDLGKRSGLVTTIGHRWWAVAELEPWVDNSMGELLGIALGRQMTARLRQAGNAYGGTVP